MPLLQFQNFLDNPMISRNDTTINNKKRYNNRMIFFEINDFTMLNILFSIFIRSSFSGNLILNNAMHNIKNIQNKVFKKLNHTYNIRNRKFFIRRIVRIFIQRIFQMLILTV